jgi:hypothetical protein
MLERTLITENRANWGPAVVNNELCSHNNQAFSSKSKKKKRTADGLKVTWASQVQRWFSRHQHLWKGLCGRGRPMEESDCFYKGAAARSRIVRSGRKGAGEI